MDNFLDLEDIKLDNLLVDFGLFETKGVRYILNSILKHFKGVDDMNLKELYDLSKIKLKVKVFNVTIKQVEYITHETDPQLSIIRLTEMTTAVPLVFKPIKYNNYLYVDGGLRGSFPKEACESDNYLGIFIRGGVNVPSDNFIVKLFPILEFMYSLSTQHTRTSDYADNIDPKVIFLEINKGLNFEITRKEKEDIILMGFDKTTEYIKKHWAKDTI